MWSRLTHPDPLPYCEKHFVNTPRLSTQTHLQLPLPARTQTHIYKHSWPNKCSQRRTNSLKLIKKMHTQCTHKIFTAQNTHLELRKLFHNIHTMHKNLVLYLTHIHGQVDTVSHHKTNVSTQMLILSLKNMPLYTHTRKFKHTAHSVSAIRTYHECIT